MEMNPLSCIWMSTLVFILSMVAYLTESFTFNVWDPLISLLHLVLFWFLSLRDPSLLTYFKDCLLKVVNSCFWHSTCKLRWGSYLFFKRKVNCPSCTYQKLILYILICNPTFTFLSIHTLHNNVTFKTLYKRMGDYSDIKNKLVVTSGESEEGQIGVKE